MNCRSCGTRLVAVTNLPGSWLCPRCGPQTDVRVAAWELEVEQLRTAQRATAVRTIGEWRKNDPEEQTAQELVWIIDPTNGDLVVEGLEPEQAVTLVDDLLPPPQLLNCAQPLAVASLPPPAVASGPTLRVSALWYGSVVEGPGRRSVLQVQGCPLHCSAACYVPESHSSDTGALLPVDVLVEALLDPVGEPCDGISVVGGEPFAQADPLAALLRGLKARGVHTTVYTGYTLGALLQQRDPAVQEALQLTDLLIDGPFVPALADHAGEWRGSRNQRFIAQPATIGCQVLTPRGAATSSG
jgi:anaerobic ribonucleoside-triphosphate reductase activating protein